MPSKTREASDSERLPVWSKARRSGALESPVAMMPTSTRATRSRFSSPHQHANGGGVSEPVKKSNGASEASRTFMQKWLEPTVQSKPSFEEAGLMRYGVTENMAPLGTLPKGPQAKKPGQEVANPVRKIILKSSSASSAVAAAAKAAAAAAAAAADEADASSMANRSETPTPTPTPPPRLPTPPANAQKATRKSLPARGLDDDDEDEDYTPKAAAGKSQGRRASASISRKSASRSSVGRRASASLHQMAPSSDAVQPSESTPENKDVVERAVEVAIDEALRHYRYPTAWALRTLYDENSSNPVFLSMFEDVYHQTADEDTLDEFSRLIEEKKREGKKDNQACYFFVPPSTNSRFTPHKPKPAPYGNLLSLDLSKSDDEDDDMPQVTPTKKARKRREIPESPMGMSVDDEEDDDTTLLAAETTIATMTPPRKRARRDSASSDSSLSELSASPSLPPDSPSPSSPPVSVAVQGDSHSRRHSATTAATAAGADPETTLTSAPPPADPQPMKRRGRSLAAKASVSDASNSNSPTLPPNVSQAAGASNMPGRLSSPIFPNLSTTAAPSKANGKKNANKDKTPRVLPSDDATTLRRRDARDSTVSQTPQPESHIRGSDMRSRAGSMAASSPAVNLRKSARTPAPSSNLPVNLTLSTRTTRSAKRTHDEIDNTSSPTAPSILGEVTPVTSSRAATPTNLRPTKKQRTGLRIKTSPMKKKGGTAAGLPRASGEGGAVAANGGGPINQDENDDYCSACSGVGELVCCENCSRSFHFECVDLGLGDTLPEEWFCNVCFSSRYPTRVPEHKGPFGGLMNTLEKTNPRAYKLPQGVRVYFEGVKVGPEGEYEDVVVPAKPKKKGYEEAPDFFKVRETDGSAVLCHNCQHPTADNRAIIPCSLCGLHWHLDCLDPPLAIPPVVRTWRCPAHADDLLATLPEELAPAHRFRKIKGAPVIVPAFSRGMKNNGFIEIDDEESEDENSGWSDVKTFGRVYKLSSKGVVLDFISQLRKDGAGHIKGSTASNTVQAPPVSEPMSARSRVEQQAVLNLVELASTQPTTKLDELTEALLTNAEPAMLSLMARGSVNNFASGDLNVTDKQSLRAMLAQMEAMTGRIKGLLGDDQRDSGVSGMGIEADQTAIDCDHTNGTVSTGDGAASIKNESVEPPADLPTPATTTQDNPEPINSLGEKSSQEVPNDANEDDVPDMDID
ncbi:PHD-finger domain-containing protein [Colletotrichum cuscutae]|uniref:PHD-finger domain-containing protein n=1 Tax=Colletotrichum cuscutae TaxID=1209917 RepID=A0AAI9XS38_9PEZI|nr:PHD-finger domain-containing protein [Colletotrichum cuscutae]